MLEHMENLLQIPGSKLLFGGKELKNHSIPSIYGALEPTAVYVPIEEILKDNKTYELVTKEIFGPFQVTLISTLLALSKWSCVFLLLKRIVLFLYMISRL